MADDGGVLENLPRSRPGQRSAKRSSKGSAPDASGAGRSGAKAATRAEERGAKASQPAPGSTARNTARPKPAAGTRRVAGGGAGESAAGGAPLEPQPSDPVGDALRLAASVAATGARVAQGVAREVLRRLPRP
jgi:hypothetical protein